MHNFWILKTEIQYSVSLFNTWYEDNVYLQVVEVHNFSQDDLMTEDIFVLDCHSEIFVWVGQQVDLKKRMLALPIGEV
jgi:hypothetical protein